MVVYIALLFFNEATICASYRSNYPRSRGPFGAKRTAAPCFYFGQGVGLSQYASTKCYDHHVVLKSYYS